MNMKVAAGFLGGIATTFAFMWTAAWGYQYVTARKESNLKKERIVRPDEIETRKAWPHPADAKIFHGQTVIKNKSCLFVPIGYVYKNEDLVWYERHRP